jgi:hypothetical protein
LTRQRIPIADLGFDQSGSDDYNTYL